MTDKLQYLGEEERANSPGGMSKYSKVVTFELDFERWPQNMH
jgi:hypothetical protein